ncbi:MAG: Rieske 2Fe-2S domain-containing protein [Alphaproteobacteria bacterium]|nr:Rieske 2Fe-2S domain-containing protein [Alphaproteobacteria bacterium]
MSQKLEWFKVLNPDELPEGRVAPVTCAHRTVCVTRFEGQYGALDNRCPHQGGPMGEGSIEGGFLRCPWHGWDYHPLTGKPPGGYDDGLETFPVEVREDGVYVGFPVEAPHTRTVSDVMAETMTRWGVRWVFGMVGHSNLGLADGLRRETEAGRLRYVGVRHEGAASFACSAYGKLTGRPAACLAIAGPGATNLLTGLWDANVDHAPVLALTGQVQTQVLGRGAFQEIDLAGAFGKVARFTATVLHHSDHAELMTLACKHAVLESGVAHLIFPDEVQTVPAEGVEPGGPQGRIVPLEVLPTDGQLDPALSLLREARRPLIIVGHGARGCMDRVTALAERLRCPVVTTFKAKGQIADDHPLGCGVLGRSGTPIASWFMNESDLLVVFGASFAKHTGITSKKPTVQVDRDPLALGRFHPVDAPVYGELRLTIDRVLERLGDAASIDHTEEVAARWAIWRAEKRRRLQESRGQGIHSAALFEAMTRRVPADAVICVDVGNNTYSFGRYFEPRGQAVLMSGYLGSIGFALPAAMGAWAATQEPGTPFTGRKVVSISGDGGLGQYLAELTTLVQGGMDITHVVLNNGELGKISKEQRSGNWSVWQTTLHNPGFARFAEDCGALGIRVTEAAALDEALARALAHPGPALVEVMTDAALV